MCPGHAIYAAYANGRCAAVSVGVRPTFGTGRAVLVETYLIDQNVDARQDADDSVPEAAAGGVGGSIRRRR